MTGAGGRPRAPLPRLYLVSDRHLVPDLPSWLAQVLPGLPPGACMVQLREKDLGGRALLDLARRVIEVARPWAVPVVINDRVDVAVAADADGVHLPEQGLEIETARRLLGGDRLVGASRHAVDGAHDASRRGASFVVCGPVWATPSKQRFGPPLGVASLAGATAGAACPVFAIGGVDDGARVKMARDAGAHGVAVIRAVLGARDPVAALRTLLAPFASEATR